MENRDSRNVYAIALVGGILCVMTSIDLRRVVGLTFNPLMALTLLLFALPHIICGIVLIHSATRIQSGKRTWTQLEKRILISSWIAIGIWLGFFIFFIIMGAFLFLMSFNSFGFAGGFLTLLGIYYYKNLRKSGNISDPLLSQEKDIFESIPVKQQSPIAVSTKCSKCGFDFKGEVYKFCPKCGVQLSSE